MDLLQLHLSDHWLAGGVMDWTCRPVAVRKQSVWTPWQTRRGIDFCLCQNVNTILQAWWMVNVFFSFCFYSAGDDVGRGPLSLSGRTDAFWRYLPLSYFAFWMLRTHVNEQPCHLHDHGNTSSRTGQLWVNLLLNMECHGIAHYLAKFLFSGERGTFIRGKHSCKGSLMRGDDLPSLCKHSSMSKDAAWDAGKVCRNLPTNKKTPIVVTYKNTKKAEVIIFSSNFGHFANSATWCRLET